MIETVLPGEMVALVQSAAHEVFSTMLNLPLVDHPAYEQSNPEPSVSVNGVEALVGIAGSWNGTGRICCSGAFACRMASALLLTPYEALNDDVLDAVSEVSNMVIGNVKTGLEEKLGPLGLSIPTVIFGRNYRTRSAGVRSWTVIPFESEGERWEIWFCLMPTRHPTQIPHAPHEHSATLPWSEPAGG